MEIISAYYVNLMVDNETSRQTWETGIKKANGSVEKCRKSSVGRGKGGTWNKGVKYLVTGLLKGFLKY